MNERVLCLPLLVAAAVLLLSQRRWPSNDGFLRANVSLGSGSDKGPAAAPPRIAVFTLVRSARSADWDMLLPWCQSAASVELFVTAGDTGFASSGAARRLQAACQGRLTLIATTQPGELPSDRVKRIALLRDLQACASALRLASDPSKARPASQCSAQLTPALRLPPVVPATAPTQRERARNAPRVVAADAVVVVDMDVVALPGWPAMLDAIERVRTSQSDVVCANGYEELLGGRRRHSLLLHRLPACTQSRSSELLHAKSSLAWLDAVSTTGPRPRLCAGVDALRTPG